MAFPDIRKFMFQNASSGKIYEVILSKDSAGAITGLGRLLGTNQINSDPAIDNAGEVTFVVLTAQVGKVFGTSVQHESALAHAAYFNASNPAGAGAALSTLLV